MLQPDKNLKNTQLESTLIDQLKTVGLDAEELKNKYGLVPQNKQFEPTDYRLSPGQGFGSYKRDKDLDYLKSVMSPEELDYMRANAQTGAELTGKFLGQMLTEAAIETLKTPGYLYELGEYVASGFEAKNEFNNAYLESFDKMKDSMMPEVYLSKRAQSENIWDRLSDATYWANQGQTVGTTLSLMIPSLGVGRLVAGAGKLVAAGAAGLFSRSMESVMEANQAYKSAIENPERINELREEELTKYSKEIAQIKDEYEQLSKTLYNPALENYNQLEAQKQQRLEDLSYMMNQIKDNVDLRVKDRMNNEAGEIAAKTFNGNIVLAPVDALQYALLLKPFQGVAKGLESFGKSKIGKLAQGLAIQPALEGGEEAYQSITVKEAEYSTYNDEDMYGEGFGKRLSEYVKEPDFQDAVAMGAAMGFLFDAVGPLARKAVGETKKYSNKLENKNIASNPDRVNKEASDFSSKSIVKAYKNGNIDSFISNLNEGLNKEKSREDISQEEIKNIESNYNNLIKQAESVKKYDSELLADERFRDNENLRQGFVLAKLNQDIAKQNYDSFNKTYEDELRRINSTGENSVGLSDVDLTEGNNINDVNLNRVELIKQKALLDAYKFNLNLLNNTKESNLTKKERSFLKENITSKIKGLESLISTNTEELKKQIKGFKESDLTVANMNNIQAAANRMIENNYDLARANSAIKYYEDIKNPKEEEDKINKEKQAKLIQIANEEVSKEIDETNDLQGLNKLNDKHKSNKELSKENRDKLENKLKQYQIEQDKATIEAKNKINEAINNANTIEDLVSISESIKQDQSISEELFAYASEQVAKKAVELKKQSNTEEQLPWKATINTGKRAGTEVQVTRKTPKGWRVQLPTGEDVFYPESQLDLVYGTEEEQSEETLDIEAKKADIENRRQEELDNISYLKNKTDKSFNKDWFKDEKAKLQFQSEIKAGWNIVERIEEEANKINAKYDAELAALEKSESQSESTASTEIAEEIVLDTRNHANKNVQPSGQPLPEDMEETEEEDEVIDAEDSKVLLTSLTKQYTVDENGRKHDVYDDNGDLIINEHYLSSAIPEKFAVGTKIVLAVDNAFIKGNNNEKSLPIGVWTLEDYKAGKKPLLYIKAKNPSEADKVLRKKIYEAVNEGGKLNDKKAFVTTIKSHIKGFPNKTKTPRSLNKQFKRAGEWVKNFYVTTVNRNKIEAIDENGIVIESVVGKGLFNGHATITTKGSDGKYYSTKISQVPISNEKFDKIRKIWFGNAYEMIKQFVLGNEIFNNDLSTLRQEVGVYLNLDEASLSQESDAKIRIPKKGGFNNHFGVHINEDGTMLLQLPGYTTSKAEQESGLPYKSYKKQEYVLKNIDGKLIVYKYQNKNNKLGFFQIAEDKFIEDFVEKLQNMYPNIQNIQGEFKTKFTRIKNTTANGLIRTEPMHYYDFLSQNGIVETKVHALKTEEGEYVFSSSPTIEINQDFESYSEENTFEEKNNEAQEIAKNTEFEEPNIPIERESNENNLDFDENWDVTEEDYLVNDLDVNKMGLRAFKGNDDVVNTFLNNALDKMDDKKVSTGFTGTIDEAIEDVKKELEGSIKIFEKYSKQKPTEAEIKKYGISQNQSLNKKIAEARQLVLDKWEEKIVGEDIQHIGYKGLIKRKYNTLKFNTLVETEDMAYEESDEPISTFVENRNYKLDPEKSASARIRRLFRNVVEVTADGKKKNNGIGFNSYTDPIAVFNYLAENLYDKSQDEMLDVLADLAEDKPDLKGNFIAKDVLLKLNKLNETNPEIVNEFISVMKKQKSNFMTIKYEFNKNASSLPTIKVFHSNRSGATNQIITNWENNLFSILEKNHAIEIVDGFPVLKKSFATKLLVKYRDVFSSSDDFKNNFIGLLKEIGIEFSSDAYEKLKYDFFKKKKYFVEQFGASSKADSWYKFLHEAFAYDIFEEAIDKLLSPYSTQKSSISNLAKYQAKFQLDATSISFKNGNGDNIFAFNNPHYQSVMMSLIRKKDSEKLAYMMNDGFKSKSHILKAYSRYNELIKRESLLNSNEKNELKKLSNVISNFEIAYFDSAKNDTKGAQVKDYENQSLAEKEITNIALFINGTSNSFLTFTPTPSDKTTFSLIKMLKLDTSTLLFKDGKLSENAGRKIEQHKDLIKTLKDLFIQSEIDRINNTARLFNEAKVKYDKTKKRDKQAFNKTFGKLNEGYHYIKIGDEYKIGAGAYFFLLPTLNDIVNKNNLRNKESLQIEVDLNDSKNLLVQSMFDSIAELIEDKIEVLKKIGVYGEKTNKDGSISKGFNNIDREGHKKFGYGNNLEKFATHYVVNNMVALATQYMITTGDPAYFAKKPKSDTYKGDFNQYEELLKSTHSNMFKRIAKDIAPGKEGNFGSDTTYKIMQIKEPKGDANITEFGDKIKEIYSSIDIADAQEYTTLIEHLKVMNAFGLITQEQYNDLKNKYYNKERFNLEELSIILQPMKPVQVVSMFDEELGHEVEYYIKTSSFPLIQQITEDFPEIDRLRQIMEKNDIARVAPPTAIKIGQRNIVDINNMDEFGKDGLTLKNNQAITLDRSGFRIQQDVPYKADKEITTEGSQLRKIITGNLAYQDGRPFEFNYYIGNNENGKITGKRAKEINDNIHNELYKRRFEKLLDNLGIDKDDLTFTMKNVESLKEIMIGEGEDRGYSTNDLLMLKTIVEGDYSIFDMPLYFHPMVHKIESLLTSMIKNKVLKSKFPGKSFVQGSSNLFRTVSEKFFNAIVGKNDGMVYTRDFNPETGLRSYRRADGKFVHQVFLTMPYKANGKPIDINKYRDKDGFLDTTKLPKDMLDMIGYRIPSQKPSSVALIEVVGILPSVMGDLIIIPPALSKQMGSDFDVDKLNLHWYNYSVSEDGTIKKVKSNVSDDILYKNYVRNQFYKNEEVDEEIVAESDKYYNDKLTEKLNINYKNFKEAWNKYKNKRKQELLEYNRNKGVSEKYSNISIDFVLDDVFKNEWIPKLKEVSNSIVESGTLSQAKEIASYYENILSYDEFKKLDDYQKRSVKQLENAFIDLSIEIMAHEEIQKQAIQPLDSDHVRKAVEHIESLRPTSKSTKKMQLSVLNNAMHIEMVGIQAAGKAGVAIESNAAMSHILSQNAGIYLMKDFIKFSNTKENTDEFNDKEYKLNDDGSYSPNANTIDKTIEYLGVDEDGNKIIYDGAFRLDKLYGFTGRLISDVLANIQTEAVDNANNRLLHPMNLNQFTFDVANLIARAGFDEKMIGLFLNQPIILEYQKRIADTSRYYEKLFIKNRLESIQQDLFLELGNKSGIDVAESSTSNISVEEMENAIKNSNKSLSSLTEAEKAVQINALVNFVKYDTLSKALNKAQMVSNTDTKYLGSSVNSLIERKNNREELSKIPIGNAENLLQNGEHITMQGMAHNIGVDNFIKVFSNILPIESPIIENIIKEIQEVYPRDLSEKDLVKINIDIRSAIYNQVLQEVFGINNIESYRKSLLYGENALGNRLEKFRANQKKKRPFLASLEVKKSIDANDPMMITHLSSKSENEEQSQNKQLDWLNMFDAKKDSEEYKLAVDLLVYSITFGVGRNALDFGRYIPSDILKEFGLTDKLRDFDFNNINNSKNEENLANNFSLQFIQHNPDMVAFAEKGTFEINNQILTNNAKTEEYPWILKTNDANYNPILWKKIKDTKNQYERISILGTSTDTEYDITKYRGGAITVFKKDSTEIKQSKEQASIVRNNIKAENSANALLNEVNFNKGYKSIIETLSTNAKSEVHKQLAKFMLDNISLIEGLEIEIYDKEKHGSDFGDKSGVKGSYNSSENLIVINKSAIENIEDLQHTILHELVHAYTSLLEKNPQVQTEEQKKAFEEISKMRKFVAGKYGGNKATGQSYDKFLTNDREFIAGIMANDSFRNYTSILKYREKGVFQKFIDAVLKIFGVKSGTVAGEALANIVGVIKTQTTLQREQALNNMNIPNISKDIDEMGEDIKKFCKGLVDNLKSSKFGR